MKKNSVLITSIILRVILPPILLLALLYVSFYFYFLPRYEEDIIKEKKETIVALTQVAISTIDHYYQETNFDHEWAKKKAIKALRNLHYDQNKNGYFWLSNGDGYIIMHPNQSELEGVHIDKILDQKGKSILTPLVSETNQKGRAFAIYSWRKNNTDPKRYPKLAYAELYRGWNWIVGTGVYLDDLYKNLAISQERFRMLFLVTLALALLLSTILIFFGIRREHQLILFEHGAQIANRAKRLFMAKVGHELRTPLNQIWGISAQLENSDNKTILQQATKILLGHIDDITTYVSIDDKSIKPYFETILLNELKEKVIELWEHSSLQRKIEINVLIHDNKIKSFKSDYKLIIIVLNSFISNAIKFSHGQSKIKIHITRVSPNQIKFCVQDNGIGISEKLKGKIWNEFFQLDENLDRRYPGLGIGLPLAKKVVEALNGKIDFDSSENSTTNFFFTIPVSEITLHSDQDENTPIKNLDKPAKILLADDDESNRVLLGALLTKIGAQYVNANDGAEAIEQFKQNSFDLVLMDVQMPRLDGIEATKSIRIWESQTSKKPTPIVAVSAFTSNEAKYNTLDAGMCDFLEKPVLKNKLQQIIMKYINAKIECQNCERGKRCTP